MMTPDIRELIAKAVDGSLTAAERKRVEAALQASEPARTLFGQLKADARTLRALPPVVPPADIAANVVELIRERQLTPTPTPPQPKTAPLNWPVITFWVNVCTAAGILMTIGVGSYIYYAASMKAPHQPNGMAVAKDRPNKPVTAAERSTLPIRPASADPIEDPIPSELVQAPTPELTPAKPELGPAPRVIDDTFLTAPSAPPIPEIHPLNIDKHRVSRFVNLGDLLSSEGPQQKLQADIRADLKADELIRMDLFCRDPKAAMELLASALKGRGCQPVTDQHLMDRQKKRQTSEVVFFTDVFTPDEVFQLMGQLAQADKKPAGGEGQFDTLVIAPFLPSDLDMLGRILGAGAAISKMPKPRAPVDIRRPLPEGTANHLAQSLSKMGVGAGKTEKLAFVGSYSPVNPAITQSKEIKQYLDRRADKRSDAKPLMLVLRTVN